MPPEKEFKVNEYITLKLEGGFTNIYVKGQLFNQCKFLMLTIPSDHAEEYDEIESVDEAAEKLGWTEEGQLDVNYEISPETEFWGHCSNLQAWYESKYDTRLLHRNLAFPLLKKLTDAGDPIARENFKEEIALRFENNYPPVVNYLLVENYLGYFNKEEQIVLLEILGSNGIDKVNNKFILLELGLKFFEYQIYEQAIKCYEKAIVLTPDDANVWHDLGNTYFYLNNFTKALKCHQRSTKLDSKHFNAWLNLGNDYYHLKKYDKSLECLNQAMKLDSDNPMVWSNLASTYTDMGNYKKSNESLLHAVGLCAKNKDHLKQKTNISNRKEGIIITSVIWYNIGLNYIKMKKTKKGIDCYKKAVEIDPKNIDAWLGQGSYFLSHKNYKQAIPHLLKAIELDEYQKEVWHNLGIAYLETKDYAKALECRKKAKKLYLTNKN